METMPTIWTSDNHGSMIKCYQVTPLYGLTGTQGLTGQPGIPGEFSIPVVNAIDENYCGEFDSTYSIPL